MVEMKCFECHSRGDESRVMPGHGSGCSVLKTRKMRKIGARSVRNNTYRGNDLQTVRIVEIQCD